MTVKRLEGAIPASTRCGVKGSGTRARTQLQTYVLRGETAPVNFESAEYQVRATKTVEDDKELIAARFEYVIDRDSLKI